MTSLPQKLPPQTINSIYRASLMLFYVTSHNFRPFCHIWHDQSYLKVRIELPETCKGASSHSKIIIALLSIEISNNSVEIEQ